MGQARTAARIRTRAERRRESLRSKIVVVSEAGEVCGKKGGSLLPTAVRIGMGGGEGKEESEKGSLEGDKEGIWL